MTFLKPKDGRSRLWMTFEKGFFDISDTVNTKSLKPRSYIELPLVLVDCFASAGPYASVVPDEIGGGYAATKCLLEKGHRRIAMINADLKYPAAVGRLKGLGFDDQELIAPHVRPALTTVRVPYFEMGSWAVEHLVKSEGEIDKSKNQVVNLECPLVFRSSASKPSRRSRSPR